MDPKNPRTRERPVGDSKPAEDGVSLTGSRRARSEERPLQRSAKDEPLETYEQVSEEDNSRQSPDSATRNDRTARDEP